MWTDENRASYERKGARYPSDVTDEEWALVEPHLPPPRKPRGTKAMVCARKGLQRKSIYAYSYFVLSVAVGTTVAGRPPHRSRRALLTHRAPPSDFGVEAVTGQWVSYAAPVFATSAS